MGGGGKGGSTTQTQEIPQELKDGSIAALSGALRSAGMDYTPVRGPTIAAFTPQQQAAFAGANQAANAFGLPTASPTGGLPQPETAANGMQGYSTGALFDSNLSKSMTAQQRAERSGILNSYTEAGKRIGQQSQNMPFRHGGK